MEERDTIDLNEIKNVVLANFKKAVAIVVGTTVLAAGISFVLPREYDSTVLIRAKAPRQGGGLSLQASAAMALLGGAGMASPTQSFIEILKSRSVLEPVIAQLDLPEEKKAKLDNKDFAKNYLKIVNIKGTDLIEITATGRSPEEAQTIAANLVNSFQATLTTMNQFEQSLMVKFLNDQINRAQKDMELAENNLEKFRQTEKIYVPDEQAKAIIKKITEYDQKVAQLKVQNETNQAKLEGINDQLRKQNAAITTYNLADNQSIQKIRNAMIEKQIVLVDLGQRFTDKHPNVILVKQEIEALNAKLKEEVANSVAAGTNTLNPIHSNLLKEKVMAETDIIAGQASFAALQKAQTETEKEISKLSAGSTTYIGLERKVRITQEIYSVLVKNYEQARIQEAMESMDIQIVDAANSPKKPSAPKKILITAIGGVIGIMISFIYVLIQCLRSQKTNSKTRLTL